MSTILLNCSICKADIQDNEAVLTHIPSKKTDETVDHVFHKTCLLEWLRVSSSCPYCKEPMPSSMKTRVLRTYDTGITIIKYVLVCTLQIFTGMVITFIARVATRHSNQHLFGAIEVGSLAMIAGIGVIASAKKIAHIIGKEIDMSPEILGTFAASIISLSSNSNGIINFAGTLLAAICWNQSATTFTRNARLIEAVAFGSAAVNVMILLRLKQAGIAVACMVAMQSAILVLYIANS